MDLRLGIFGVRHGPGAVPYPVRGASPGPSASWKASGGEASSFLCHGGRGGRGAGGRLVLVRISDRPGQPTPPTVRDVTNWLTRHPGTVAVRGVEASEGVTAALVAVFRLARQDRLGPPAAYAGRRPAKNLWAFVKLQPYTCIQSPGRVCPMGTSRQCPVLPEIRDSSRPNPMP